MSKWSVLMLLSVLLAGCGTDVTIRPPPLIPLPSPPYVVRPPLIPLPTPQAKYRHRHHHHRYGNQ